MRISVGIFVTALVCLTFGKQASANGARITSYLGPSTCLECHGYDLADDLFNSAHFQFRSPSPFVTAPDGHGTDWPGGGSHGMMDRACGLPGTSSMAGNYASIATSPVNGTTRSEGCGNCHVSYRSPLSYSNSAAAAPDMDCLRCHAEVYGAEWDDPAIIAIYGSNSEPHVRKVVAVGNPPEYIFTQDRSLMTAKLARNKVTVKACERCHKKNMGGYKRATPQTPTTDVHTAKGMLCTACHITKNHKIARGNWVTDMMASDSPATDVNCAAATCHGSAPHSLTTNAVELNRHTNNLRCEVCHITTMEGVTLNLAAKAWSPSTWDPRLKKWDATPATTAGKDIPNFWDAYAVFFPSTGTSVPKPTVRWFNGIGSSMAQPYGGYSTRASAGGKSKLQPFKQIQAAIFFEAAFLPGPPTDGSYDLVNSTWPHSSRDAMERSWTNLLQLGLIDAQYPTPASYWQARPDMAVLQNMVPKILMFDRAIFQYEGGVKIGTPPEGVQSVATYPGIAKAIDKGMGNYAITMGKVPANSDPMQVGPTQWSGSFFGMWKPSNMDETSPFYHETGLFMTMSHAVKANFGAVGTTESCYKCHQNTTEYKAGCTQKHIDFVNLDYPDVDGNGCIDRMYDVPSQAVAPTFTPLPGLYNAPQSVQIRSTTTGASIRYTTDGSTPTATVGTVLANGATVTISRTGTVLKAVAFEASGIWDTSNVTSGTYTLQVANPVLTPGSGSYTTPQTVTFSSATPAATICYTTDGTAPTRTNGLQIPNGSTVLIDRSMILKAFAFSNAMLDSRVTTATYTFLASFPKFSPGGGTCLTVQNVVISTATVEGRIRYTTDGSTPTGTVGTDLESGGTVVVDRTLTLRAVGYRDGWTTSSVVGGTYTFKAIPPVLSLIGGTYADTQYVTITSTTPDALIRCTTDGTLPTPTSGILLNNGDTLIVNRSMTLKAIAYRDGWTPTAAVSATYTLKAATPRLSPLGSTYYTPQTVTITSDTDGASISFTTDGSTPSQTNGTKTLSGSTVVVDRTMILKAVAFKPGWTDTNVVSGTYTFRVALPVVTPLGGIFSDAQYVTITSATTGASLRYTTDGVTLPTPTAGTFLNNGDTLLVNRSLNLKAIAYRDGWTPTTAVSATYTLKAATPTLAPLGTTYYSPQSVKITSSTLGVSISYTTDGSTPSQTNGAVINSGDSVLVDRSLSLKAVAFKPGWTDTTVVSGTYTFRTTIPVLSVLGGTYADTKYVTITTTTPGASIRYTTDGVTLPTDTVGTPLANGGTVAVDRSLTLKAIACRDGWTPTTALSATYTLKAATPTLSPIGSTYYTPQTVTITTTTPMAQVSYTTDGSTPSQTNGNRIPSGAAVLVDRSLTLKAVAFRPGWTDTTVVSGTYTFRLGMPALSPFGGTYSMPLALTVTMTTPGASIRYTTDGTMPTCTDEIQIWPLNGDLVINRSMVLKIIACRYGWTPSSVLSATYTLKAATPTLSPLGTTYYTPQNVTITSATAGATISYTTDGSTPSQTNGSQISSGATVTVDRSLSLKAVAFQPGWTDTTVVSGTYTFRATLPVLSVIGGTYADTQNVAITSITPGASIRYTTDGVTLPTDTVGTPLANGGMVVVDRSLVLKAIAYRNGWIPTTAVSATYTLKAANPTLSPPGTTYYTPQTVTITSVTAGTTISYTTDGSTPSQTNGNQISSGAAVLVDRSLTLKAVAFKPGWTDTTVVSGTYTFRTTLPVLAPAPGLYSGPQNVTISTTTPNALIRYTTDGTIPTPDYGLTLENGGTVTISQTTYLKAIAYRDGWTATSLLSGTYTIKPPL